MATRVPFESFCGPSYSGYSPVIDSQRCFNLIPEPQLASSKSSMALMGRPGLSQTGFATTMGSTPARTLWAGNNRLFGMGGTHFYEFAPGGGILTDFGAMAGSAGTGWGVAVSNQPQLLVCDPSAGKIYLANSVGPAITAQFNGVALEYLDGFYVAIATGASLAGTNPNQLNSSALNDGTSWPGLNFALRVDYADLITQLAVLNGQLFVFGQKSISVYYNAGNSGFPFARIQGAEINLGLMAAGSVVKFNNTIMWLGADNAGYAQVYMLKGLSPVRVSNFPIEALIALQGGSVLPLAVAHGYQEAGHTFYVLTIMSQAYVPQAQYVYDLTTGLWHERIYATAFPVCFASTPGFNSNGPNFVGDGKSGKVMFQGNTFPSDLGGNITYIRQAPHASNLNKWTKYSRFEIDGDFGTAQPTLDYSDDGGRNYGGRTRALQQAANSARNVSPSFRRFFAMQCGRSRDRVFQLTITDSTNLIRISNAYLDVA